MADAMLAALCKQLAQQTPDTVRLLEELVAVNSHTANVAGVEYVGQLIKNALRDTTLMASEERAAHYAPHLCFSTKASASAPSVLLIGHHDTVFPAGTFEGFRRAGEFAYGPGVLDMKGGLCVIISVLKTLDHAGLLERLPVRFVTVSDEEVGSPSSREWLVQLAQGARCALVFEAGRAGDALITARRGSGHALVTAHGKAAHAGNALADGRNAIWALSCFIDEAQQLNGTIAGASLNVGLLRGGSARNTVPDSASCELDLRFSDDSGQLALSGALQDALRKAEVRVPGTRLDLSMHVSRRPWARSSESAALCIRYGAAQVAAGLACAEAGVIGGGSDANTVGALGIATIDGLGPRGRGFHTHDEQIEVASLALKAEALLRFLVSELNAL